MAKQLIRTLDVKRLNKVLADIEQKVNFLFAGGSGGGGVVTSDSTTVFTHKTISGSSNTLSNIGNSSLTNSSVTIGSTSVSLGATASTIAGLTLTAPVLGTPTSGTLTNCTFPTLNQNTSGSAASLSVSGQSGLITLTGITSTNRIKTVRDAADTILELGGSYSPSGVWTSLTLVTPTLGVASCTSITVTGASGAGFIQLANQASAPSTPTTSSRIFVDSTNRLSWKGTNGFVRTFDGTANSADRVYVLPNAGGNITLDDNTTTLSNKTYTAPIISGNTSYTITQSSHGFAAGDVLKLSSSTYAKAQADSAADAEVIGIVAASLTSSTFSLVTQGYITGLSGLVAGTVYFLSASSAGALTATEPTTVGQISKPLLVADTTSSGYFMNMRGVTISTAPNLNVLTRTTVADAAYVALSTDYLIAYTSLSAGRTVTLPLASTMTNAILIIKDEAGSAGANNLTADGNGAETVDGSATKVMSTNYGSLTLYCNGTAWFSIT